MTSCFLKYGLGNQLFEISTAYALSLTTNDDFGVDFYKGIFDHKPPYAYYDIFYRKINKIDLNQVKFDTEYHESSFNYSKIPEFKNTLINGFFQSEKYFNKYYNEICELFINDNIIDNLKNRFSFENSLSIHVRRGDYLKNQNYFIEQTMLYYLEGIKYIESKHNIEKIYIFSDDIEWCKNNFVDSRCIFVEKMEDYEDLYMMSLCEHNIIANSSFSWWGSYLNQNKNKIVIAPKKWFGYLFNDGDWADVYYKNNIIL